MSGCTTLRGCADMGASFIGSKRPLGWSASIHHAQGDSSPPSPRRRGPRISWIPSISTFSRVHSPSKTAVNAPDAALGMSGGDADKDEAIIGKHAETGGFPATKITEAKRVIDPTIAAA